MSQEKLVQIPLLKPIDINVLEEIQYSQITLDMHATLEKNQEKVYDINLIDDIIVVYSDQKNGTDPLGFIRLDFSLKFQRIYQIKNFSEKHLNGFKLINDFGENLSFFTSFESLASVWISHLSKKLNQNGFHNFYRPVRMVGKGAFATVYEIIRLEDGKRLAAKVFAKEIIKNNQNKMRTFLNQLEILRNIEHDNLLKLEGVCQSQDNFYVIVQIINGGTVLESLLKKEHPLNMLEVKTIIRNILLGLAELQQLGIVHRDIKLENIMLRQRGQLDIVIIDFGLSVFENDEDYIYYQCGTSGFMSPEVLQLKKGDKITPKSDIFSLGVILHVLLTGKYLFDGKSVKEIFENNHKMNFDLNKQKYKNLDPQLFQLMTKMLAKNPEQRLSARQCLNHPSLKQRKESQAKQVMTPVTATFHHNNYHF